MKVHDNRVSKCDLCSNHGMNYTLKMHIIIHHFIDYFECTGETMRTKSAEFTESAHSKLRKHKEIHGYKVVRKLGTPIYLL